jgi:hypothetical protein
VASTGSTPSAAIAAAFSLDRVVPIRRQFPGRLAAKAAAE